MYGSTYIIYFKIYNYLKMYKKPQTIHKTPDITLLTRKQKVQIKKYIKQRNFKITLSPIYE
jgi:hypothetical protein